MANKTKLKSQVGILLKASRSLPPLCSGRSAIFSQSQIPFKKVLDYKNHIDTNKAEYIFQTLI